MKVLIGISPVGLITFISKPYGGNSSDGFIMEKEILNKIEPGDGVMVDRGFNVSDLLLQRGAKLYMPPFRNRIHVERAIERMKNFKILTTQLDSHSSPRLYQMLVVIAVFCNFSPPLFSS